jgi:hypothetical protein
MKRRYEDCRRLNLLLNLKRSASVQLGGLVSLLYTDAASSYFTLYLTADYLPYGRAYLLFPAF